MNLFPSSTDPHHVIASSPFSDPKSMLILFCSFFFFLGGRPNRTLSWWCWTEKRESIPMRDVEACQSEMRRITLRYVVSLTYTKIMGNDTTQLLFVVDPPLRFEFCVPWVSLSLFARDAHPHTVSLQSLFSFCVFQQNSEALRWINEHNRTRQKNKSCHLFEGTRSSYDLRHLSQMIPDSSDRAAKHFWMTPQAFPRSLWLDSFSRRSDIENFTG